MSGYWKAKIHLHTSSWAQRTTNEVFISTWTQTKVPNLHVHTFANTHTHTDTIGIILHSQIIRWKHSQTTSIFRSQQAGSRDQLLIPVLVKTTITNRQRFSTASHTHHKTLWCLLYFFNGLASWSICFLEYFIIAFAFLIIHKKHVYLISMTRWIH